MKPADLLDIEKIKEIEEKFKVDKRGKKSIEKRCRIFKRTNFNKQY